MLERSPESWSEKAGCYYNMTRHSKTSVHFDLNWNYFGTKSSATKIS
jgi:hypothetical protein